MSNKPKATKHIHLITRPASEDDDDDEPTEVTKLHELLEETMAKSCERLDDVARKGDVLKYRLRRRPGSVSKMQAVLSRPPPAESPEPTEK